MKKKSFSLLTIGAMVAGFIACKEEVQYDIEISNPKTTLTVGEKIDIKITSQPEGLDLSAVEYEFSPEGIIDASHTDNGFRLVAKKKGTTTLTISCGKFEEKIPFTVKAKPNNNGGSSDSGSSSGGSDSGSSSSDSDGGGGSSSSDGDDSGSGEQQGGNENDDQNDDQNDDNPTQPSEDENDGKEETPGESEGGNEGDDGDEAQEPEAKKRDIIIKAGENGAFNCIDEHNNTLHIKDLTFSFLVGQSINISVVYQSIIIPKIGKIAPSPDEGYVFDKWDREIPNEMPDEDITITALFKESPTSTDPIEEKTPSDEDDDPFNGHEYVDLNLPSGNLWATCNLGATSYSDYGDAYSWGEEKKNKTEYQLYNYWDYNYRNSKYLKYNTIGAKLDINDDVARREWGGKWQIPSKEDFEELLEYCKSMFLIFQPSKYISFRCDSCWPYEFLNFSLPGSLGDNITSFDVSNSGNRNFTGYYWTNTLKDASNAYVLQLKVTGTPYSLNEIDKPNTKVQVIQRHWSGSIRPIIKGNK